MLALTLPSDERRAHVIGFWCLLSGFVILFCVVTAWWLQVPRVAAGLAMIFAGVSALAVVRPHFAGRVYRGWNRRIANPFGEVAVKIVTKVAFFAVFVSVGRAGRRGSFAGASGSATRWVSRESLPPTAYAALYAAAGTPRTNGGWLAEYIRWATRTGNFWSVTLLPYFLLLMVLHQEEETAPPANIYTLF